MRWRSRADTLVLVIAMGLPAVAAWLYFQVFGQRAWMPWLYGASKVVQFSLPAVWALGIRRRPFPGTRTRAMGVAAGLLSGAVMATLIGVFYVGFLRHGDLMQQAALRITDRLELLGALTPVRYLLVAVLLSVLHALLEEYYWRWYLFGQLQERLGTAAAGIVSSLAFATHHIFVLDAFMGSEHRLTTALFAAGVAAGGGFWVWLYHRYGNLVAPWTSHIIADAAIMAVGYDLVWNRL